MPIWVDCLLIVCITFLICLLGALFVFVCDEIRSQKAWNKAPSDIDD